MHHDQIEEEKVQAGRLRYLGKKLSVMAIKPKSVIFQGTDE
jgi:hypothetical protein